MFVIAMNVQYFILKDEWTREIILVIYQLYIRNTKQTEIKFSSQFLILHTK
jgi:hypothetical protein